MSYDIYFVRRDPGQTFEDALEETEDSYQGDPGPLTSVELEQWERILPRAREILGELQEFGDKTTRELSHEETGIQLTLFAGEVSITVPYWHSGDDAVEVMRKVYTLARAVEDETGLEGYDPQLEEAISEVREADAGGAFRRVTRDVPAGDAAGGGGRGGASPDPEPSPRREPVAATPRPARRWWEFWKQ